jgi:hypothetical protein
MNTSPCCRGAASGDTSQPLAASNRSTLSPTPTFVGHVRGLTAGIIPGAVLVLIPKCPACIAAYIALGTGIGLSMSAATYVRIMLLLLCITAMTFFVAKYFRRLVGPLTSTRISGSRGREESSIS